MLFNIVFNAIDAIPEHGTVTFKTSLREDLAVLQVADTGTGMTEEVRLPLVPPTAATRAKLERLAGELGLLKHAPIPDDYVGLF